MFFYHFDVSMSEIVLKNKKYYVDVFSRIKTL